jgi:hypothetical protein
MPFGFYASRRRSGAARETAVSDCLGIVGILIANSAEGQS